MIRRYLNITALLLVSLAASMLIPGSINPAATKAYGVIKWGTVNQEIDGFGAAAAQNASNNMSDAQADMFFSEAGIYLSLIRVQIPPDGTVWSTGSLRKAIARGARAWAVAWSAPAAMKDNNNIVGGSLLPSSYQAYAEYLIAYVKNLQALGINLYALSVQNEPDVKVPYISMSWTSAQIHAFIKNNLGPLFASSGLTTKIIMPEESWWDFGMAEETLNDPAAARYVSIVAAHGYDSQASPYPLSAKLGKRLWQTEVSTLGAFDPSMNDALFWARNIHDWMTVSQVNAWHYWSTISNHDTNNEGLLSNSGQPAKRFYAVGNFSKFIRPGYYRIGATANPLDGVFVSAYRDLATKRFVIVTINSNKQDTPLALTFDGFKAASVTPWVTSTSLNLVQRTAVKAGGGFSYSLEAESVTTFVGLAN